MTTPWMPPDSRTAVAVDGGTYDARLLRRREDGGADVEVWVEGAWYEFAFGADGRCGDFTVEIACVRRECTHPKCSAPADQRCVCGWGEGCNCLVGFLIPASKRRTRLLRRAEHLARFAPEIDYPPQRSDDDDADDLCHDCATDDAYDFAEGEQLRWCSRCGRLLVDELTPAGALDGVEWFEDSPPKTPEEWLELWVVLRTLPEDALWRCERIMS